MQLKIPYKPPFHWEQLLHFFGTRAIEPIEWVDSNSYSRAFSVGRKSGILKVTHLPAEQSLQIEVPANFVKSTIDIVNFATHVFDLNADSKKISSVLRKDPAIAKVVRKYPGIRLPGAWSWFEIAMRAVLGQQITVRAARTIAGRIVQKCGTPIRNGHMPDARLFPTPEQILEAPLTGFGIPSRRVETIRYLAKATLENRIPTAGMPLHEIIQQFCSFPGIGPWTAHYIALRGFGEKDVFLPGDVGLRRAAVKLTGKNMSDSELMNYAERWRPWRSYAVLYLWASLVE